MLQLEEVFLDNYLEKKLERETILDPYLESYNSLSTKIDRIRFASVLGDRMMHCEELVEDHDRIINSHLSSLKEQIFSYFGVEAEELTDIPFILAPVNEDAFNESLVGQTDLFVAHLHVFVTALKKGIAEGSFLKEVKENYKGLKKYGSIDANSNEPPFDDLQFLISESTTCCNLYIRSRVLQKLLSRIGDINYDEDLTYTPRSEIVRNHSVQVPSLVKEIAKNTAQKSTSTYHPKTIEIYLNQYRNNPNQTRSDRIKQCISMAEDETIHAEFTDKCVDSTLKRWEDKLDKSIEDMQRFSGLKS